LSVIVNLRKEQRNDYCILDCKFTVSNRLRPKGFGNNFKICCHVFYKVSVNQSGRLNPLDELDDFLRQQSLGKIFSKQ